MACAEFFPPSFQVQAPLSWITASTVFGALHGLETFTQLIDRIELPKGDSDDRFTSSLRPKKHKSMQQQQQQQASAAEAADLVFPASEMNQPELSEETAVTAKLDDIAGRPGGIEEFSSQAGGKGGSRRSLAAVGPGAILDLGSQSFEALLAAVGKLSSYLLHYTLSKHTRRPFPVWLLQQLLLLARFCWGSPPAKRAQ